MKIIVAMSGFGERFRRAGYKVPKPLIKVEQKPIIAHIVDLFPNENDFLFICNQQHLNNKEFQMEKIIKNYCPTGKIIGIPQHKLGPVHAVQQVNNLLNPNEQIIVNYCDFSCYWNWSNFKKFVTKNKCAGAIPAYKGFHPHSLGNTKYAYIQHKKEWITDIQEKKPFTNNPMLEFASSGTYYFASAKIMHQAFNNIIKQKLSVEGEYYVSLAYKNMINNNHKIALYPLQHFMQWGTPEDLLEYNAWSNTFKKMIQKNINNKNKPKGTIIIPMAGLGKRFANEGYKLTKPLIPVSGMPMVTQATRDLPKAEQYAFIVRKNMPLQKKITEKIKQLYPQAVIQHIDNITEGQACSAIIGLNALNKKLNKIPTPITIAACDNGAIYNSENLNQIIKETKADIVVWGIRGYSSAIRNPHMFGWIKAENGQIQYISVKKPLKSLKSDPIAIGTFTFCKEKYLQQSVQKLIERNGKINGEYYIDSAINDAIKSGLKCYLFEVDNYLPWGTPNELRTFEYWQACFHKWKSHPYRIELDERIPENMMHKLKKYNEKTYEKSKKTETI